jgi:hypothetical protein
MMKLTMKTNIYPLGALLAAALLLSGCDETKRALGQTKDAPDEFAVYQRAPLSLPPEYGLKPPTPGAERPQAVNPRDRAVQALGATGRAPGRQVGSADNTARLSPGERSVLQLTGATNADPSIRLQVDRETSILATESVTLTDKIAFWNKDNPFGTTVDPSKEARRIRENQALGKPLNRGDIPIIKRKKKAILEDVFK